MTYVVLTLEKDRHGVWITRLTECLQQCGTTVDVLSIEDVLHGNTDRILLQDWKGIINRVSDAADPILFKGAVAFLQAARVLGISIWNGPDAYSLCGNKWCHHILFQRAGLHSPTTFVTFGNLIPDEMSEFTEPVLAKPNAGGFGAGVQLVDRIVLEQSTQIPHSNDNITLLQQYIPTDRIYRVWFLRGHAQCGVVRTVSGESDFSTGCTGQVCTKKPVQSEAFKIPEEVENEIQCLCKLVPDAHCGSIEFLYDQSGNRQYFDFNLLSTLPFPESIQHSDFVWGVYDPWEQQANEILDFFDEVSSSALS